jgi:acetyl esterase/lipase
MNRLVVGLLVAALFVPLCAVQGQKAELPEPTEKRVYKEVEGKALEIWIWKPVGWKKEDRRSAVVFYHGGGWKGGSPTAFARQSAKLAEKGMVAFSVQYRLTTQPGVTVVECVKDARSAFRWVKTHAGELGVDVKRIAAGGGSAGGHLAAGLVTLGAFDDEKDDRSVVIDPVALVLFNPAVKLDFERALAGAAKEGRKLEDLLKVSPYHHLKAGHPPTVIFHGDEDTTVPIESVQAYAAKVKELGGACEVVVTAGQGHAFFNREPYVWQTLARAEGFLRERGLLMEAE